MPNEVNPVGEFRQLVKDIDSVHSKLIRYGALECITCGEKDYSKATCSHLFKREGYSTRWDITPDGNCHMQCMLCNQKHEEDPTTFTNWYISHHSREKYDALRQRHFVTIKPVISDLRAFYKYLDDLYNRLVTESWRPHAPLMPKENFYDRLA
jgi:hypothetical protein